MHGIRWRAPLFVALVVMVGYPLNAQDVASTSKSGKLVEKLFWDKKETQPKLYREYYELKSFDKDDKLLSTRAGPPWRVR